VRRLLLPVMVSATLGWCAPAWAAWSSPFGVSTTDGDAPRSLFAPDGTAYAWWEDVARYAVRPPAGPFGPQLSPFGGAETIDIDVDASSRALFAWVTGGGEVKAAWRSPQTGFGLVETVAGNADDVDVDVNPQGEALVLWTVPGGTEQVRVAYSPAGQNTAFDDTPQVLDTPSSAGLPHVVLDPGPQPDAVALWIGAGDVRQATTSDASANDPFATKTDLDVDAGGGQLHVASNAAGVAAAVWRSGSDGVTGLYPRSSTRSPGGAFGAFQTHGTKASIRPHAAVGADGTIAAVWEEEAIDTETCLAGSLRVAHATGGAGGMTRQGYVGQDGLSSLEPGVAVGPTGQLLITWYDGDCEQDGVNAVRLRLGGATHTPVTAPDASLDGGFPAFDADGDALGLWVEDGIVRGAFFTAETPIDDDDEDGGDGGHGGGGGGGATGGTGGSGGTGGAGQTATPGTTTPPGPPAPRPPSNLFSLRGALRTATDGTATFTLIAPGPGAVSATATQQGAGGRAAQRRPVVARGRARARRAGAVRVTLRPTTAGKRLLRRRGRLRVRVTVTFTPTGGAPRSTTRTVTLRLKRR
jgi:hypothetical protein